MSRTKKQETFALSDLVWVIGYQLTAYIGRTAVETVAEWLQNGLPEELESRMKAALDVALPIAEVESELTAQDFLIRKRVGLEPYKFPATMLRDADVQTARVVLMEEVKREFLANRSEDLESIECRLNNWISQAKMPPHTKYKVLLNNDRLSLNLLHVGISEGQQTKWDKGEDWPLWTDLIAAVPEMATSRVSPDLQTGCPFRYLRRTCSKPGLPFLNSPAKKEWLHKIKTGLPGKQAIAKTRMLEETKRIVLSEMRRADEIAILAELPMEYTRQNLQEWKAEGRIFSVEVDGIEYFPLFALDPGAHYQPYPAVLEVLRILEDFLSPWGIAEWFVGLNSFLDDQRPQDLLAVDPAWVIEVAKDEDGEFQR